MFRSSKAKRDVGLSGGMSLVSVMMLIFQVMTQLPAQYHGPCTHWQNTQKFRRNARPKLTVY